MRMRSALLASVLAVGSSALLAGANALRVAASGPTLNGAGSTWVQIALDQWRADIAQQGYSINYSGIGSSAGRQAFIQNTVDFAASEIPFQPGESPSRAFEYLPDVAGGTALMYNLHAPDGSRITSLKLDAHAAARIFTGGLTSWQDSEVQSLNPGLTIQEPNVNAVVRSDGSGTSAQFSLYLASQAPSVWNPFAQANGCPAPCSLWPPIFPAAQNGSDGVASFIADSTKGPGGIGYVEAGYAQGYSFPVAALHNASGNYTLPTAGNVATALQHAGFNADNSQNLSGVYVAPEANAYPMSSYSYLIAPTSGFDPAKGAVLGRWLIYIACGGQREAAPLGYSPLPPVLVKNVFDAVHRIPGAPATPAIDNADCPNPTVTNPPGTAPPTSNVFAGPSGSAASHGSAGSGVLGPSASAGAGATATAGATAAAGLGGVTPGATDVATLGQEQRNASFVLAQQTALHAQLGSSWPFLASGIVLLIVVFVPVFISWRRGPRPGGGGDA